MSDEDKRAFSYALLRAVPSIERGESINIGVVLFCRQHSFLAMKTGIDPDRLAAFAPDLDPQPIADRLGQISDVIDGNPQGRVNWPNCPSPNGSAGWSRLPQP